MKNTAILIITFLFINIFSVYSQEENDNTKPNTFELSGQFRPRAELRNGTFKPIEKGQEPAILVSDRIRLQADYSYKNKLTTRITLQNVSIWGQGNMVQATELGGNKIAIFEAWADVSFSPCWGMKLGRQIISLDDERFFGALDWAQGGRVHDALSFHYNHNKIDFRSYFAFNQNYREVYNNNISNPNGNLYNTSGAFPYKAMQTLWLGYKINDFAKISGLVTNLGFQNITSTTSDSAVKWQQTIGANFNFNKNKSALHLAGYYQFGKNLANQNTNAYLLSGTYNYQIHPKWNLGITAENISGNDLGTSNTDQKAFTPYFGTNHKFNGVMDYYYTGNGHQNVGLLDFNIHANYKVNAALNFNVAIHQFFSDGKIPTYESNLGQELDLGFNYAINNMVKLIGGYSMYFTTPTLEYLKNTTNAQGLQNWVWLSVNVTPKFLNLKY